ncbi:unnamed protein product [Vitrella brassicaformis CCMP3155]|uniref:Uncharacterized protein n=1 Tax=Vitrella brassicaformis (strain CCMP3155) TaxID=1169540 RepID=A0A0G4H4Q5_VITBC|nr:unnamed protein product [Vitrella brassicaformis CCMP3155]|eukprot:CEM38774.1 unnamed protein product [Vitrella brassicaformis CCMP3155]
MSSGPVGLLDGCAVYEDGKGGYALEAAGQRLPIEPSFHSHIKFCIKQHRSAVGSEKGQEEKDSDGDQPPPAAGARATADEGAAAGKGDDTTDDGLVGHSLDPRLRYKVVHQGTGNAPTMNSTVKVGLTVWRDAFHGNHTLCDVRVAEFPVPDIADISDIADIGDEFRDELLSMREGEVRRYFLPVNGNEGVFVEARLVSVLDGTRPPPAGVGRGLFKGGFPGPPPAGATYEVVREGTGNVPTLNSTVKLGLTVWRDAFDGNDTFFDAREWESSVLVDDELLSMREGEMRRAVLPADDHEGAFGECRLVSVSNGARPPPAGHERSRPPSPPAAAGAAAAAVDETADSKDGTSGDVLFRLYPSGAYHQVVRPGSGPKPTRNQRIKVDRIRWNDDFDGEDKIGEYRGDVRRVSEWDEWVQEALTDMRVGEVRCVIAPGRLRPNFGTNTMYAEYTLVAIL